MMANRTQRSYQSNLSLQEIADRLAIRDLIDAYAHCADRRDVERQMSLFAADTEFLVYMDSHNPVPTQEVRSRDGLRPVFENLKAYEATTHFNGQSTVGARFSNGDLLLSCTSCGGG